MFEKQISTRDTVAQHESINFNFTEDRLVHCSAGAMISSNKVGADLTASPASFPRTHFNQMNAVTPDCNTGWNKFELCCHSIKWHAPGFG